MIAAGLDRRRLRDVDRAAVMKMLADVTKAGKARKRARGTGSVGFRAARLVARVTAFAVDQGWLASDPIGRVRKPANVKAELRARHLSADELKVFWQALGQREKGKGVLRRLSASAVRSMGFALLTGARIGEITAALTRADVDLALGDLVFVRKGKTAAATRTVPMSSLAREIAEWQMASIPKRQKILLPRGQR